MTDESTPTDDEQPDYNTADTDVIGVAWHEHAAIGDATEVYPAKNDDDNAFYMRDILTNSTLGPAYAIAYDAIDNWEFVTTDGEEISPQGMLSIAEREDK